MTKIIGITGGIASGKSTVVEEIRKAGYQIIDADRVVHDLQAKGGKLYVALLDWLGQDILTEDGELNRPKLAQLIFSSPENLTKSSQLQDEIIRQELADQRDALAESEGLFFMDIPLLIEGGYADWFDEIWLLDVAPEVQLERLMSRNHYSREEAQQRIASQMPSHEKKAYASHILDNNGSLADLQKQVKNLLARFS